VIRLERAHTADLDAAVLDRAHALLEAAFDGRFSTEDWEHALGGVHVLAWEGPTLIGHASVVQRQLLHQGRPLRTGYVEGVAVLPTHRRRGHAAAMMTELENVIRRAYDVGALGASDEARGFYQARGWQQWRGPTAALTPSGVRRTPEEDGGVYVLPVGADLDLSAELACDWRDGDVW